MRVCILAGLVVIVVAVAEVVGRVATTTYVVGDNMGWKVPMGGAAYFESWASSHVFMVGDVLVFNFTTDNHNVAQVTKASFDACKLDNPLNLITQGPAKVPLNSTGMDYYLCTKGRHCSLGQKLAINVTKTSSASSPTPTHTGGTTITTPPTGLTVITMVCTSFVIILAYRGLIKI